MPNRPRKHSVQDVSARKDPPTGRAGARLSIVAPKFTSMQLAELLRPFWMELLQNNIKNVKKFLRDNRARIDFNTARYTACADGTGLHLCAQHGFIACAKLLLDFGVKIDLPNKVGSTALHVACKFNQDEMVLFLLEMGARMDVPDLRNNVAFDVAPYTLLDKCILSPQRAKLEAEQQEETRLLEKHQAAVDHFEEVTLAKAHASMLLIDCESHAWEEWQALKATNKVDLEWSEQVQRSRDTLEIKQAVYLDLQVQLQKEENQIAQTWKTIFRDARDRQERAREEMEQMLMLTEETHQLWMREQQDLWDQCGLIETAQEFPNDADVQQWVLGSITAMIDPVNPHQELLTMDIDALLVREEIISVIRIVLLRFPKTRDLQLIALQCLVRLVCHCIAPPMTTRAFDFLTALIKANVMVLSRDVLSRFKQDVELAHVVIELLYHLLQFRGENGAHSLQFCQNRSSQQLPLQVLRLHEAVYPIQDDTGPSAARHHASFLLFTLTKYNVRKILDEDCALPDIRRLILALSESSSNGDSTSDEVATLTLRYLIGSLALIQSPSARNGNNKTSPRPDVASPWSVVDLSQVFNAIRPWLAVENRSLTNSQCSLAFWTIKLLRNLTLPQEEDVVQLRTWLRTRETFDLLASTVLAIRKHKLEEGDDTAVQSIVVVWLELVEDIWLCRYNSDGQLAATAAFILEALLQHLELEAQLVGVASFINVATVLKLIALVLSNGKNMRYLVEHEYKIDVAVHDVLKKLLDINQRSQDIDEASTPELLAHILRVYLCFFDYERDHIKSGVNLHERCRAIGICAVLQAFNLPDSRSSIATSKYSSKTPPNSKLKTKMQLARAWSVAQQTQTPERETLRSLARALLCHAPCNCY
ncbi:hypothetical protein PC129_g4460 [Phytophthora cactorum]|uniref:Uncharacterized protein n=1 Tax=Phytophthora cactorum TaxID=29920 RepID=A0A329SWZ8_9STRA|nr:hypothetical protein Pcac1_g5256 [Phytophthora cactorum]KAG3224908.1 hypothetical protein PC129_g4460 [Phytophthora cactorum]RAW41284.1 hypothetical protein PC110_g2542 [Phytophthora cactorum]